MTTTVEIRNTSQASHSVQVEVCNIDGGGLVPIPAEAVTLRPGEATIKTLWGMRTVTITEDP